MNVYAIADLHGNLPEVPPDADLLLIAGDICPDFRPYGSNERRFAAVDKGGTQQARWLDTEFRHWLHSAGAPVVVIWGNHDFVGERPFLVRDLPWTLLHDSEVEIDGLRIYGTPWVPGLPSWAFYGRQEALLARSEAIPKGIDLLMTHGPPYGAGDFIPTSEKQREKYGNRDGMHVGDVSLPFHIERAQPQAVVCGHIHEARGTYKMGWSTVYNVAAVDALYDLHPDPWVKIELDR